MHRLRDFLKAGGGLSDLELLATVREVLLAQPIAGRREWLRQLELMCDGYGSPAQVIAGDRIRAAAKNLEREAAAQGGLGAVNRSPAVVNG